MSPEVVAAIIAASVSFLTLIGTLVAQYLGRRATSRDTQKALELQREQLDRTLTEQREQLDRTLTEQRTRTLNERFATAAEQLGSDKPPVRLAGVYAMAGLADDWKENRQTCVDVLCAYLRMPYAPDPGQDAPEPERLAFQASREVRHTVIRVIVAHLRDGAKVSWQGQDFDFTGVVFDGGNFSDAVFSGGWVSFDEAEFSDGNVYFNGVEFSGSNVYFLGAKFSGGEVEFLDNKFSGGSVIFGEAEFSGSMVNFSGAEFSGGTVEFGDAKFSGGWVSFVATKFSAGGVYFSEAEFSGGEVTFYHAKFSGGNAYFNRVEFSGGQVDFIGAEFSGGQVDFTETKFSGGQVDFTEAKFSGGQLDFRRVSEWSSLPVFPWPDTPPSGVRLPEKEGQSRA